MFIRTSNFIFPLLALPSPLESCEIMVVFMFIQYCAHVSPYMIYCPQELRKQSMHCPKLWMYLGYVILYTNKVSIAPKN